MTQIIPILEVIIAIAFFTNKVFLLIGRRMGWVLGLGAATVSIGYFFLIELYLFMAPEAGFAALMGYRLLRHGEVNRRVEISVRTALTAAMAFLAYFLFEGSVTLVECVAALLSLWAMYFLTHDYVRQGWATLIVAHVLAAIVFDSKGQEFFTHFQIASAFLAIGGVVKGGNSVIESSA